MKAVLALVVLVVIIVLVVWLIRSDYFADLGSGISGDLFVPYIPNVPRGELGNGDSDSKPVEDESSTSSENSGQEEKPKIPDYKIPKGFTADDLSIYFDKVSITSVSRGGSDPGSYSRIEISGSVSKDESINISGWVIAGNKGSMIIPQGVEFYSPTGSNVPRDIPIKQSDHAKIYSTESPLGINIKLNKCTGYLETVFDFTPQLPLSCPRVDYDNITYLRGDCQDYIRSLGTCELPNNNHPAVVASSECKDFVDDINYRGCYETYGSDENFPKKEWRIFMGDQFMRLDSRHDRLLIYDRDSFLVDEYTY